MGNNALDHPLFRAFGLNVQCELPGARLFGMAPINGSRPDAVIRTGSVPRQLARSHYEDSYLSVTDRCLLLKIKGVARYLISNGNEITVEIETDARDGDVATFAFGSAMGALLYQRGILALHGSAVCTARGAAIFCGEKGAGKSTTAAALAGRGWEFMSDDVCAVHLEKGNPVLYPGLARAKLSEDSYAHIYKQSPKDPPISPILKKYGAFYANRREPAPLYVICVLETSGARPYIEPIRGAERLSTLSKHIYRPLMHRLMEEPARRFRHYALVAAAAKALRVFRPIDYTQLDEFLGLLEKEVLL